MACPFKSKLHVQSRTTAVPHANIQTQMKHTIRIKGGTTIL